MRVVFVLFVLVVSILSWNQLNAQGIRDLFETEKVRELTQGEENAVKALEFYDQENYKTSLHFNFQALKHLTVQGNEQLISEIKNLIGNVYAMTGLYKESTKYYIEAIDDLGNQELQGANWSKLIKMNIGLNYQELGDFNRAESYFKECDEPKEINSDLDTNYMVWLRVNVSLFLIGQSRFEEAIDTLDLIRTFYPNLIKDHKLLYKDAMAKYYEETDQFEIARKTYKELQVMDSSALTKIAIWNGLASLMIKQDRLDSAQYMLDSVLSYSLAQQMPLTIIECYDQLVNLYKKKGMYKAVYDVLNEKSSLKDSLFNNEDLNDINELLMTHELDLVKAINENKLDLVEKETRLSISQYVLLGLGMLIITLLLIAVSTRIKAKRIIGDLRLRAVRLEQEQLSTEIDDKDQDLSSFSDFLIAKKGMLEELKSRISLTLKASYNPELEKLLREINHNNYQETVQVNSDFSEGGHQDFMFKLDNIEPALTVKEKRLAALVINGLTSKEIAEEFSVEPGSVDKSRYRLRKKLGIDKEVQLQEYLMGL